MIEWNRRVLDWRTTSIHAFFVIIYRALKFNCILFKHLSAEIVILLYLGEYFEISHNSYDKVNCMARLQRMPLFVLRSEINQASVCRERYASGERSAVRGSWATRKRMLYYYPWCDQKVLDVTLLLHLSSIRNSAQKLLQGQLTDKKSSIYYVYIFLKDKVLADISKHS